MAELYAYSSATALSVMCHIIAPIVAAMAVAAGVMQVAAIKQQQASQAQGYAEGVFIKPDKGKGHEIRFFPMSKWDFCAECNIV